MKKSYFIVMAALAEVILLGFVFRELMPAAVPATDDPSEVARATGAVTDIAPSAPVEDVVLPAADESDETGAGVSFFAVGDIMLSRNVAAKMKKYGAAYPFASTSALLQGADFAFGNLESPITPGPIVPTGSFTFHADPGAETALKDANFKVLSLANNHFLNYGKRGVADTLKYLAAAGIKGAGAGLDEAAAYAPAYLEIKGLKLAFLAYSDYQIPPTSDGASGNQAGTAKMDPEKLKAGIGEAEKNADLVIVSMHAGREYTEDLTAAQTEFAHAAVDAGAGLVLGHHPHVTQRVEKYKDKYIFYSLGNFIFDQMWSEETRRGTIVKIFLDKAGFERAEILPTRIFDYAQPRLADSGQAEEIWRRFRLPPADNGVKLALPAFQ